MIGKLFVNDGANAVLVIVLSGMVATLVAHARASHPRRVTSGAREGQLSPASEGRARA